MKTERNILIAFILNFVFSIFEFVGGIFTGSVAIISDAIHDMGDATSIGISYFLEKKSKKQPDEKYTYGYARFSVIGGVITTLILLFGSCIVIYNAINRIIYPKPINFNGMIIFAVIGVLVNFIAAYFTREKTSINQKAVNLHMLEDVLGWAVVLVGAIIMRFTNFAILDPILSIAVALFILIAAFRNLKEVVDLFLEKTPNNINTSEIKEHICEIEGVLDVHHIHIWSLDGENSYATIHIVADGNFAHIKHHAKHILADMGISHATIETENKDEMCSEKECITHHSHSHCTHHHHHH